jgi:hypothetical protein
MHVHQIRQSIDSPTGSEKQGRDAPSFSNPDTEIGPMKWDGEKRQTVAIIIVIDACKKRSEYEPAAFRAHINDNGFVTATLGDIKSSDYRPSSAGELNAFSVSILIKDLKYLSANSTNGTCHIARSGNVRCIEPSVAFLCCYRLTLTQSALERNDFL